MLLHLFLLLLFFDFFSRARRDVLFLDFDPISYICISLCICICIICFNLSSFLEFTKKWSHCDYFHTILSFNPKGQVLYLSTSLRQVSTQEQVQQQGITLPELCHFGPPSNIQLGCSV
jgi:hypothetical protein